MSILQVIDMEHKPPLVSVPLESLIAAKEAREIEQAECLARILASMEGYPELHKCDAHIKQHFVQAGYACRRMAALSAEQFRHLPPAYRHAAQKAHEASARIEGYAVVDISQCPSESRYWYDVTTAAIRGFWEWLGKKERNENWEVLHGDPRRI